MDHHFGTGSAEQLCGVEILPMQNMACHQASWSLGGQFGTFYLPIKPGQYSPAEVWVDCRETREVALWNRLVKGAERCSMHTRDLKPLKLGSKVIIQNQHGAGKIAKRWDRTGLIIDDLGYNKYSVKVDGSGRVTDRNRQSLRQFTPATQVQPGTCRNNFLPSSVLEVWAQSEESTKYFCHRHKLFPKEAWNIFLKNCLEIGEKELTMMEALSEDFISLIK